MELAMTAIGISVLFLLVILAICGVTRKNALKSGLIAFHLSVDRGYETISMICFALMLYRISTNHFDMQDYSTMAFNFTEDFFSYEIEQCQIRIVYDIAVIILLLAVSILNSGFVTREGWYYFSKKKPQMMEVISKNGEIQFLLKHNEKLLFSVEDVPQKRQKFAYFLKDEKEGNL